MPRPVRVMVACGSGVATSTVAKQRIEKIAADAGIPIKIIKCTIGEVPARQGEVDIVCTTANYRNPLDVPHLSVFGLLSGIGAEGVKNRLLEMMKTVQTRLKEE